MIYKKNFLNLVVLLSVCFSFTSARAEIAADLLAAAEKGDANAQYSVARSYQLGKRVKSDKKKALEWYTKAADQGHLEASYRLGLIYYKGIGGYKTDFQKAFKYLSQSAKGNHKRSQTHLAKMYENGDGVDRSEVLSDYWYEQAFSSKIQSLDDFIKERSADEEEDDEPEPEQIKKAPVEKKTVRPASKKAQTVSAKVKKFPHNVLKKKWTQNGKPSRYLSSSLTRCKLKSEKLVCSSGKTKELHSTGLVKYKVRSIITPTDSGKGIRIVYKRLYLSVPGESIGGYDDEDEQKTTGKVLTVGWEKASHTISCQFESSSSILCRPAGADAFYIKAR